ncbi:hypothetical protein [Anaerobacillus arseniciselenatis]|nr:hypothetical protein [Anaerobacillus arseniciselenatis]
MIKGIDLQMISFVSISLFQDYITYLQLPRVYYWKQQTIIQDEENI